eukprot:250790-Prorocentrum_minimum.AAC.3
MFNIPKAGRGGFKAGRGGFEAGRVESPSKGRARFARAPLLRMSTDILLLARDWRTPGPLAGGGGGGAGHAAPPPPPHPPGPLVTTSLEYHGAPTSEVPSESPLEGGKGLAPPAPAHRPPR